MVRLSMLAMCCVVVAVGCDERSSSRSSSSASVSSDDRATAVPAKAKLAQESEAQRQETESGSHLRQIGMYLKLYENEHGGTPPEKVADLVKANGMPAENLRCPRPGFEYVFTGKSVTKSPRGTVIGYERGPREDANILFAGGGVLKYPAAAAKRIIAEGRGKPEEIPAY